MVTTTYHPAPNGEEPTFVAPDGRLDRPPPHDHLAEQCVLGGMLLSKAAIADVIEIVKAGDFYRGSHSKVFEAILDLFGRGEPTDPITVADRLADSGDLVRVGGAPYLHTLIAAVPTASNAGHYARIVGEKAVFRRLAEAGSAAVQLGHRASGSAVEAVDTAQQLLYDLSSTRRSGDWTRLAESFQPALDEIEAAGKSDGGMRGISTGFIDLDRLLNGLCGGQLALIAGRPGLGKSTAAADFSRACSIRQGLASAIFSLEMPKVEIVMRLLSAEARVPLHSMRSGQLNDDDWTKLARRMGEIEEAPLFIDDTPSMSLMEIRAKARRLKQQHDLKLIVVDYLQLLTPTKRLDSRQQEVSEMSRGLKLLAMEIDCAVIGVCQLNRGPEQRADKRPVLSDLRESGSLEQDADIVMFVHRDDYYDKESPRAGEGDFIVAKHRNGPTDTITVAAQLHLARFVDMAIP